MDVARAALDGVDEGLVDQLDDRGLFGIVFVVGQDVGLFVLFDDVDPAVVGQGDILDELLDPDGVRRAVVLVDGVDDAGLRGDDRLDGQACPEFDVLDDLEVGRIDHGQGQEVADAVDRHDHVFLGHVDRDQGDDLAIDVELVKVDIGIAELAAESLGDILFGQIAQLDE